MTNREIINMYEALYQITDYKFPAKIAFAIVLNKNKIESIYQAYIQARKDLLDKYSKPLETNPNEYYTPANDSPYWQEQKDLDELEIEIEFRKFSLDEISEIEIPLNIMNALMPMIAED